MLQSVLFVLLACGQAASEPPANPAQGAQREQAPAGTRSDVTVDQLEKALAEGAKLIDVRTPREFTGGHVKGAVNLPLGFKPDDPKLAQFNKEEPLYVICAVGGRSSSAASMLAAQGYHTLNVTGGTNAWVKSGRPVEK